MCVHWLHSSWIDFFLGSVRDKNWLVTVGTLQRQMQTDRQTTLMIDARNLLFVQRAIFPVCSLSIIYRQCNICCGTEYAYLDPIVAKDP